ncbi:hypothetical protein [Saccharopolyspora sp. NPDC002376]
MATKDTSPATATSGQQSPSGGCERDDMTEVLPARPGNPGSNPEVGHSIV